MFKIFLKAAIYTFLHISTLKIVTDTIDTSEISGLWVAYTVPPWPRTRSPSSWRCWTRTHSPGSQMRSVVNKTWDNNMRNKSIYCIKWSTSDNTDATLIGPYNDNNTDLSFVHIILISDPGDRLRLRGWHLEPGHHRAGDGGGEAIGIG